MDKKPLILVVDDDSTLRFLAREALEQTGFVVDEAGDGAAALQQARLRTPDLIMLDVKMPVMDGFETCMQIRADNALKHIPVLMVTGLDDLESIEHGYRVGATNFVPKPIQWNTLPHNIHYVLRNSGLEEDLRLSKQCADERLVELKRENVERQQAEVRMHYMALHDALTGLPNRTLLHDLLNQAIAQARRNHQHVAVLMLDLDGFKHVNDSLGHHVGDRLLEAVAVRLRGGLRESDIRARLGGDEFVIALPDVIDEKSAAVAAQQVLHILADPYLIDGHELQIGGSIGISLYPNDGEEAEALLRAADTAMYDAKDKGRGIYRFFTSALNEAAQTRLSLANDLRHALERNEFVLYYQPQVSVQSGIITGVEALMRWNHPQRGLVSPAHFIPLLEETRRIVEVGKWVLRTACAQNAAWQKQGLPPIRMAVNLSAVQFYYDDIVETVADALLESGLPAEWLELEFTESLTLDDTEHTLDIMHRLKQLGVRLSVDDFGTGWSSLSYLRKFPLDRIKIDQSFMRDLISRHSDSAVVRSILSLAENLGLDCIAEGVETEEQLSYLRKQMCPEIQGFLFSAALPEADATRLLKSSRKLTTWPNVA